MIWPAMLFNLCVGLLFAGFLLRAVRRLERRADALMAKLDQQDVVSQQKFDVARDEIRASMREKMDRAIVELSAWTTEKNARRCHLIDREIEGTITADEAAELEELQTQMRRYVNLVAPLPLDEIQELHDEMVQRAASSFPPLPS